MGVELNMFEEEKYKVIIAVCNGQMTKERAELKLDLSRRQINRLVKRYSEEGKAAFLHGNTHRKPATTLSVEIRNNILKLYRTKYESFNVTHFVEKLNEDEAIKVSYSTVHKLLLDHHLLSPKAFRQTKSRKREELKVLEETKDKLTKQEAKTLNELEGVNPLKAHPTRSRKNTSKSSSKWTLRIMIGLKMAIMRTYTQRLMTPREQSSVLILTKKRR